MRQIFFIAIIAIAAAIVPAPASAQKPLCELHGLLFYVFFDSGSAVLPDRYRLFVSSEETNTFSETNLPPNSLDVHHHILNIVGSRMQKHPETTIEIVGCNSDQKNIGEVRTVSEARGRVVYDYLVNVWGIDTGRIKLMPARDLPVFRSNPRNSQGIVENRRAEIRMENWEIVKPIITVDTTPRPELRDSTLDIYTLILFKFDSPDVGPINDKIIRDYLIPSLRKGANVHIVGHTDTVGLADRNLRLSEQRANTVSHALKRNVKSGIMASLETTGVGEDDPIHSNELPEGRFYNRCVQVRVTMAEE